MTVALDLPVTLTFIAISAGALMPFTAWIGLYRDKIDVLRGDGGDPVLFKRIRIHGNFIETAPLTALALAGAEALGAGTVWLWFAFVSFFAGRILHYFLYDRKSRGVAMFVTTFPGFALALWTLWRVWTMM